MYLKGMNAERHAAYDPKFIQGYEPELPAQASRKKYLKHLQSYLEVSNMNLSIVPAID